MGAAKRITISLPEEIVRAADGAASRQGCSRSELIRNALQWHLRVQALPVEEPTRKEREALAAGARSMPVASSRPSTRSGVSWTLTFSAIARRSLKKLPHDARRRLDGAFAEL